MFAEKLPEKLRPYSGIIYFVITLVLAHFAWKFMVRGDETDTIVTLLGIDISRPFNFMANHVARVSAVLLHLFNSNALLLDNNIIRHDNGVAVRIVWSCTGIKQAFIFTCLILFYQKNFLKKVWFIPTGIILIYIINILRIASITGLVKYFPGQFDLLHEYVFKYLFYILIFGMWVLWDEKIKR